MATKGGLSEAVLASLAEYDTPTVCNVVELFDVRPRNRGYMNDSICACYPQLGPMVGYALTSSFRSDAPPRGGDVYAGMAQQVERCAELPGPPVIVFQDLDEPTAAATFGEVMCTTYKAFGARGLITSGAGRDLHQVEALRFPVFTNGTICAHGYCHILAVGAPVSVGGITVYQGDLLHGDRNGVTTIPHEVASEVPGACKEFMAAEDIVLNYVRGKNITVNGMEAARAECGNAVERIAKRLRRKV